MKIQQLLKEELAADQEKMVKATYQRLTSLNIPSEEVIKYLKWAYNQSQDDKNQLDLSKYKQHLNQLPSTSEMDELHSFQEPKQFKHISLDELLQLLNGLLFEGEKKQVGIEVVLYSFLLKLSDGYEVIVSALENTSIQSLIELIAQRESIVYNQTAITIEQEDESVLLSADQYHYPLNAFDFAADDEIIINYLPTAEAVVLSFLRKQIDTYAPVEIYQKD